MHIFLFLLYGFVFYRQNYRTKFVPILGKYCILGLNRWYVVETQQPFWLKPLTSAKIIPQQSGFRCKLSHHNIQNKNNGSKLKGCGPLKNSPEHKRKECYGSHIFLTLPSITRLTDWCLLENVPPEETSKRITAF